MARDDGKIILPELCLVLLIGPSGCGKSSFARKHFKPTEVLSSDFCRGLVSDDENNQAATGDAFDVLKYIVGKRLSRGLLSVVDATNVQAESRAPLVELAREHDALAGAIVLDLPEEVCHERNKQRADRDFGPHVVRNQSRQLRRGLRGLEREGFRYVYILRSQADVDAVAIERQPLWNNRKWDAGPFDIIGDVHGCCDELVELLGTLGYDTADSTHITPPPGRKAVFLGDLVDRGPNSPGVLALVSSMVNRGHALCVPGNHDVKLVRKLRGRNVELKHGLAETMEQLSRLPPETVNAYADFLDNLVGHYVLDNGQLVVAHAGMKQRYIGRASRRVREFALYGETTGETDEFGLPVRHNWAAEYRGDAAIVYGHTPVPEADWLNRTINIDTGCVFGGKLSALRWPEREIVSAAAKRVYAQPARPFLPNTVPHFGQRTPGVDYIDRSGSYAIARRDDDGHIAVIRAGNGGIYLPGGGADAGETPEETLMREAREECGREMRIGREIARAVQYVDARDGYFAKQCTYFDADFVDGTECAPTEPDHELVWLAPDEAVARLVLEADRWAVRQALSPAAAAAQELSAQQIHDDVLDLADVLGKRIIPTRLHHSVTVREENAIAALEVMSRFAADRKWLIYLPPTMSPTETSARDGLLEHPDEAFAYFRAKGVARVICQEKHMGSRAVAIVCRDENVPLRRFGVRDRDGPGIGIIYTRTGRRFFDDFAIEQALLRRVNERVTAAGLWDELQTDWLCLDCELMPWSAKAQELLANQYAAVGSAARGALAEVVPVLRQANDRYGGAITELLQRHERREQQVHAYVDTYRRYCWPVDGIDDLRLAPFHLLASEDAVHIDKDHAWHMATLARLACESILATNHVIVDLCDAAQVDAATGWWEQVTARGGEGMVIKPIDFVIRDRKGLVQPAIKCRGREYLRIIYGPEYDSPENLPRLRGRRLGGKRSLALREFALGVEALERFVRREPLRRVHECVFAVLALESEPVDPRL